MKTPRLPLSLTLALTVSLFFVAAFTFITPLVVSTINRQQKQTLVNQTKAYAILATGPVGEAFLQYRDSGTNLLNGRINTVRELYTAVTDISIYDVKGAHQFSTNHSTADLLATDAETFVPIFRYDPQGYLQEVVYPFIQENNSHRYTIVYQISSAEIRSNLNALQDKIMLFGILIVVIVITLLIVMIEWLLVRPLKQMSRLAATISAGNYDLVIQLRRNDEIRDLGNALTHMAASLKADIAKLKQAEQLKSEFLIISSHNLRTPLTVITGYAELLQETLKDDTSQKYLATITEHAQELIELTNDMITVAELEGNDQPKLALEAVDLRNVIKEIEPTLRQKAASKKLHLEILQPVEAVQLTTQKTYLTTAIWNLLDNAIKFTAEGGHLRLVLSHDPAAVRIAVQDSGIGIAPEEQVQLFTKFHRGNAMVMNAYEGVGLGLYMTKLMLNLLGADIQVQSIVDDGSTFTIILPKNH